MEIIGAYAPQSGTPTEQKNAFYEQMQETQDKLKKDNVLVMMGGLHARLNRREEGEQHITGKHILTDTEDNDKSTEYKGHRAQTRGNRDLFTEYCKDNKMYIANTKFQKTTKNLVTHRAVGTMAFGAPWGDYKLRKARLYSNN